MNHTPKEPKWRLAQVKPNSMQIADRHLKRQGFRTFSPLERKGKRTTKGLVTVKGPYFPGYLFVEIDPETAPWRQINSTQGVARLVAFGAQPASVPTRIIQELQNACDSEGCIMPQDTYGSGDAIEIVQGPFSSFLGKIESVSASRRAWVLLDVMGKETRVNMDTHHLRSSV